MLILKKESILKWIHSPCSQVVILLFVCIVEMVFVNLQLILSVSILSYSTGVNPSTVKLFTYLKQAYRLACEYHWNVFNLQYNK